MRGEARAEDVAVLCPLPGGAVARKPRFEVPGTGRWFSWSEYALDRVRLHLHYLPAVAVASEAGGRSVEVVLRVVR